MVLAGAGHVVAVRDVLSGAEGSKRHKMVAPSAVQSVMRMRPDIPDADHPVQPVARDKARAALGKAANISPRYCIEIPAFIAKPAQPTARGRCDGDLCSVAAAHPLKGVLVEFPNPVALDAQNRPSVGPTFARL